MKTKADNRKLTPFEKAGYTSEDRFKIIGNISKHGFDLGDIVRLYIDDGTNRPVFIRYDGGNWWWVDLNDVEKIDPFIEKLNMYDKFVQNNVEKPSHYQLLPGIEVYDVREAILSKLEYVSPCELDDWSRAWEYLTRMWGKNGLEDAKKARWYLNKLIERMDNES